MILKIESIKTVIKIAQLFLFSFDNRTLSNHEKTSTTHNLYGSHRCHWSVQGITHRYRNYHTA
ncbi:hypothetical protein MARI151_60244 [Maribacter litoralis]|uniref:Uncharacterized protein n=1 Tax=Maribacter litoralis TaxID=2059726 RepID=A0A653WYM6_9FLAO|nr:hypothetical protein MARI151_60244 [Maribacter litoralis]